MHNTKDLRKNLEKFKKKLLDRNFKFDIKLFEKLDNTNRELISKKEKLEQEKKKLSKSNDKSNYAKSKKISKEISKITDEQIIAKKKLDDLLHILPNLALDDVPVGKDEKSNKLIKQVGKIKQFSFMILQ